MHPTPFCWFLGYAAVGFFLSVRLLVLYSLLSLSICLGSLVRISIHSAGALVCSYDWPHLLASALTYALTSCRTWLLLYLAYIRRVH